MKKLFFTLLIGSTLISIVHAQAPRFGFTVGGTLASYRTTVENESQTSSSTIGFSAGVIADIPIGEIFTFQPSLQYLQKGGSFSITEPGESAKNTLHIDYLDLPLNFLYKTKGEEGNFVFGLGPCLSYGLGGKSTSSGSDGTKSQDIKFGSGSDDAFQNAFEFSGNIVAGYQWKSGFLVQANYNMGLSNLWNSENGSFKNSYFGLRIGYLLGSK